MGFPLPLPVRCQEAGKRKWKCALLRPASHGWGRPSRTRRAADAVAERPCLTAVRSHASGNPGRDEGMDCFDRTKGWKHAGSLTFQGFFRVHQLSWVGGLAPPNLVPIFAAHHIECPKLGWVIHHPFGFCRNKYFPWTLPITGL